MIVIMVAGAAGVHRLNRSIHTPRGQPLADRLATGRGLLLENQPEHSFPIGNYVGR